MTVSARPVRFCKFLDMLIMHYFNDKPCFLMLNFAHNTLCLNKIDPMSRKSMLERSVTNRKSGDLASNAEISGRNKNAKKI